MNALIDRQEKYASVKVEEGKLDALIAPELKSLFTVFQEEGFRNIIADLQAVKYIDSSGLSAILVANRICKESQGEFVLVGVNEHVLKLIKISQLDKVLNILPSFEEAVDFVFMSDLEKEMGLEEGEEDL
jgi:anti-anti-sigma factor